MLGSVSVWQGDRLVCEVEVHNHDELTAFETARLIAAAPELMAALHALVDSFETHRPKALWDAARAAIVKAGA